MPALLSSWMATPLADGWPSARVERMDGAKERRWVPLPSMSWVGKRKDRPSSARCSVVAVAGLLLGAVSLAACSGEAGNDAPDPVSTLYSYAPPETDAGSVDVDPLEPFNRGVYWFNDKIDLVLLEPVARAYRWLTPEFVRIGVRNFFRNLGSPGVVLNSALQGDFANAGKALGGFVVNSVAGIGGLLDHSEALGLQRNEEDFGQTLGVWGTESGPFLMLPLLGPSTVRDTVGFAVDFVTNPLFWITNGTLVGWGQYEDEVELAGTVRLGVSVISGREKFLDLVDELKRTSLDVYASQRSGFLQRRKAMIENRSSARWQGADEQSPSNP